MKGQKTHSSEIQNPKSKIQNPRSEIKNCGTLYIVSTPIGNLEDITLRALKILKSVDLIAAENVKHSKGLCRHYGIETRLTSYHQHNRNIKGPELIRRLKSGLDIALVTNAGTPAVSDPGGWLINQVLEHNINVSPIPGPSAVMAALSVSGFRVDRFLFIGFLSNKPSRRRKELRNLISEPRTMVFFEAPHRIKAMLMDIKEILGDRQIVVLRELTKVYEEIKRGFVSSILEKLDEGKIRGEFTLVVAGSLC
jgi:16S rRNA (cytidine1402-2'-O)-methyltransferase